MTSGRVIVLKHSVHVQRRMNERPEHAVHDSLSPLLDALRAFHAAILETCLSWTPELYLGVKNLFNISFEGCAVSFVGNSSCLLHRITFMGGRSSATLLGFRGVIDARN